MKQLRHLFESNQRWADGVRAERPDFFERLSSQQAPEYLWIGCSDSRVPANVIVGLYPGELFVHRNVGNLVVHTDLNCLSTLQFAVDLLKVKHVIVTGHYGCSGVKAALENTRLGLIDNWLRHLRDVHEKYQPVVDSLPTSDRVNRLCELNVLEQARNVCETTVVQDAWARGQSLAIHAWIYGLHDGRLRDLGFSPETPSGVAEAFRAALAEATRSGASSVRA